MDTYKAAFLFSDTNDWITTYIHKCCFDDVWSGSIDFFDKEAGISGYDVVFILGYTKILNSSFLKKNTLNLVVHESAVPFGKGFSPLQWQILSGADNVLVTLLEAIDEVDSGDIILQERLFFDGSELYDEIRDKQASCTISLIKKFFSQYPNFNRKKQEGNETIFRRRKPEDNLLYVDKSIKEQFNLMRVGNNDLWPSYFYHLGHKYILKIFKED